MPACLIHITGIVQGVGFRPFVYSLAEQLSLTGWVCNTTAGVDIHIEGTQESVAAFVSKLRESPPPLAHIDTFDVKIVEKIDYAQFSIIHSTSLPGAFQPVSPDIATCPDCLHELFDPSDPRYLYPFINCTNCGPRFTIIEDLPYDRPNTAMAGFALCPVCAAEYKDPRNRRFHAQPVACPDCGPSVWLEDRHGQSIQPDEFPLEGIRPSNHASITAILIAQRLLMDGKILAVKGLGGFHLACDAENASSVEELRSRKLRVGKPFAVMMPDLETVERYCILDAYERKLITSITRPVVILKRRPGIELPESIAPNQRTLGAMLPYTPLHHLLFFRFPLGEQPSRDPASPPKVLVMTSGNLSEEPIAFDNQEAHLRLAPLADYFLFHNRPIRIRLDDSVLRSVGGKGLHAALYPIRRSRGYAPVPVPLTWDLPPLLAAGTELKNTFCLARGSYAFISHHIGDMENFETLEAYEDSIRHYQHLFRIRPELLACDLHPDYLATRYAVKRAESEGVPYIQVQHHHAHIAACMAEHGLPDETVIGVAFDGTGYGPDGAVWGGEFMFANYRSFQRSYHLKYIPLPGGDAAIRTPARTALATLWAYGIDWDPALPCAAAFCAEDLHAIRMQLEHKINTPLTSSMGRLFDAAASLCGIRQRVTYEAQAAVELEQLCELTEPGSYPSEVPPCSETSQPISLHSIIEPLVLDCLRQVPVSVRVAFFLNSISNLVKDGVMSMRILHPEAPVILSGGVWQNMTLLHKTISALHAAGVDNVFIHSRVPPNDGGVSLGQAAVAYHRSAR